MGLRAKDVVLTDTVASVLETLERSTDSAARAIARRVRSYRQILLADCLHGEVVKKNRIPKPLGVRYGLQNMYVEDLPSFWRLLYTVVRDRGERYVVLIEIVDHATYSKWFPGRGR